MKKLKRYPERNWLAGICGGIGVTYDVDPTIVRLVFIFATIATGIIPLAVTYLVAWVIVPEANPSGESPASEPSS